jgi:hypothetical protein
MVEKTEIIRVILRWKGLALFKIEGRKKLNGNSRPNTTELMLKQKEGEKSRFKKGYSENHGSLMTKNLTLRDIPSRWDVWRDEHIRTGMLFR